MRVVGVEDRSLDGPAEDRLRVVDEIGVERIVARDQHRERVAAVAPGATGLLPQRRAGARPAGDEDRVEPADVDAELERVRARHAEEVAVVQRALEGAAVLGEVAGAVRRDPVGQLGYRLVQRAPGAERDRLGAAPGAHERDSVRTPSATRSASRLAASAVAVRRTGAPCSPPQLGQRRLPQHHVDRAARRGVLGDLVDRHGRAGAGAVVPGSATVAEARMKTGSAP